MPNIVMSKLKDQPSDKTVKAKILTFLTKLADDDTSSGLHIEKMTHAVDARARTARVDGSWRAVLYRLDGSSAERTYVYAGTFEHDTAIKRAQTLKVSLNAVNGVVELIEATMPGQAGSPTAAAAPALPSPAPTVGYLTNSFNYVAGDLISELGFDAVTAQRLLSATSEMRLLDQVEALENAWQQTAALGLAVGDSLDKIRADLRIDEATPTPADVEISEDDRILESLQNPASKMQFAFVENDDELRRIIEGGDFGAWRVFLHPEQEKYATGHWNGPFRLSGGAGTGKTVVLLHRTRHLLDTNPGRRVVLTTFTRALGENLARDLDRLDAGIQKASALGGPGALVRGVDQLAVAVRDAAGAEFREAARDVLGAPLDTSPGLRSNDAGWSHALEDVLPELPSDLTVDSFFVGEYLHVILPGRVTTREQYFAVRRPGRGVALDRRKRDEVWKVVERYRTDARLQNVLSWAELASVGASWLEQHGAAAGVLADHVLIDEAQDLTPAHWRFLRALAASGPDDLFIAEDTHQRIYGQHVVLGRFGIAITGRARRLTLNYRTTEQNLRYALAVLEGGVYVDPEDAVEDTSGYRSARRGPAPSVRATTTDDQQFEVVGDLLKDWLDEGVEPGSIAVLTRTNERATSLQDRLLRRDITLEHLKSAHSVGQRPAVMTMHTAKGMEFSRVVLFDVSDGVIPNAYVQSQASPGEREDVVLRERSLLYVAASRARDELVVTWKGKPSILLGRSS